MYIPTPFAQTDRQALSDLVRAHPLAILVASVEGRLEATHVPCLLDADGQSWTLRFHLARPNPTCAALDGNTEVMVVFRGPECYVSPDWYASDNLVPTWNYAVVHAYGRPAAVDDAGLRVLLDDLSASQEAALPKKPWTSDKLPADLFTKLRGVILGYRMPVERIEGAWKLSQNRTEADRAGLVSALETLGGDGRNAVARLMGGGGGN